MIYAVILLFTGGIIVLFTYIITLISNIKVTFLNTTTIFSILWVRWILCTLSPCYFVPLARRLSNLYLKSSIFLLRFLGIYLIIVLFTIVKLISSKKGPIKSFFKNEI